MCVFWTHHRTDTLWHLSCLPFAPHHAAVKVRLLQHVLAHFTPFEGQVVVRCMDISHFLHPLSQFWTLSFGSCAVFLCINFCWKTRFSFLGGKCPAVGLLVAMIIFIFYMLWNCHHFLCQDHHFFLLYQQCTGFQCCLCASPALGTAIAVGVT